MILPALPAKDSAEVIPVTMDFSNLITSIDSVTWQVSVKKGSDAHPEAMLFGSAQTTGAETTQLIRGGVSGASYLLRVQVTANGLIYALAAILPVVDLA